MYTLLKLLRLSALSLRRTTVKDDWSVFTGFWREKLFPFGPSLGVSEAFLGFFSAGDLIPEKHRRTMTS